MKEGEEVDKLFKKRLEEPGNNLAYNEDDWDALEQMMDAGKKRPLIVYWLPIVSGIAAMLLLVLGWYLFKGQTTEVKPGDTIVKAPTEKKINNDTARTDGIKAITGDSLNNVADNKAGVENLQLDSTPLHTPAVAAGRLPGQNNTGTAKLKPGNGIDIPHFNNNVAATSNINNVASANNSSNVNVVKKDTTPPAANNVAVVKVDTVPPGKANMVAQRDTTPPAKLNTEGQNAAQVVASVKPKVKTFGPNRPQFALSVIASGDVTGVNSLSQGKTGSNFGAMFTVSVNKWSFTTGAMYAIKPYATSFANYTTAYQFKTDPTEVTADCRMLDIPLNVGYRVYQKGKNKFALGTGLTSYFMLHENYKYTYSSAYANGPTSYQVPNPKNYLLSTVNLNATFEHQVNSKFSLSVQPYMKLPISAVGYSNVNLHTAGVAVGFNWNINSFTKPK
ncbi:porin family protein [Mucilaginibacter pedocola]|uniref:Outer membrane protein beta-barrel domain-containing protein n=1 Tax=Mucilaginibacter pedocola TaxID=1792845 RepID=A0A1S9P8K0_9SPHI|nr:hypothetical protein [Mucilaginibacter pedocola]OOQ57284.1 hypothetical protein BC343_14300 [Mucilaginibacter pedocola]